MSRPLTLEQSLLSKADKLLADFSPYYEQQLLVLEACAARIGGFDIREYWASFGTKVADPGAIKGVAESLFIVLEMSEIPVSLALSSLAREPISISEKKQNGAFYTDFRLAQFVAEDCKTSLRQESSVADIAAGSGILLAAVADLYYELFPNNYDQWISKYVYAFDLSENALRGARIAIATHASTVASIKQMFENWLACDTLLADDTRFPQFDIVVGNPPWGKVKLSLHTFVNKTSDNYHIYGSQYGDFDREQFQSEKQNALEYSRLLKTRYSLLGSAEPDLYMAFLQKAICLLKPGGHLSYIVPAGLIRSQGTEVLRRFLIGCSDELKYYLLDNKANYFEIDTRFKFIIVSQKKALVHKTGCKEFFFEIYKDGSVAAKETETIRFCIEELEKIRPDLTVPECRNAAEKDLFIKICENGHPWKDDWMVDIAREVDMTNDRSRFHEKQADTDIPVIEGRMVQQFRFGAKAYVTGSGRSALWVPSDGAVKPQYYISREALSGQTFSRIQKVRAGYCDIAGQTNERAMMAAVVPAGVVCGNKVPTIVFPEDDDEKRLYFFIGVANSFVFDWILRRVLSTTVNYFLLFSLPMPSIDLSGNLAETIISHSRKLSRMGSEYYYGEDMGRLRAELDIAVAKAYGLSFTDLELLMRDFPLLDRHQPAINGEPRSTYTTDLLLSIAEKRFDCTDRHYSEREKCGAEKKAKAYIPTEMTELCKGGAT